MNTNDEHNLAPPGGVDQYLLSGSWRKLAVCCNVCGVFKCSFFFSVDVGLVGRFLQSWMNTSSTSSCLNVSHERRTPANCLSTSAAHFSSRMNQTHAPLIQSVTTSVTLSPHPHLHLHPPSLSLSLSVFLHLCLCLSPCWCCELRKLYSSSSSSSSREGGHP